MPLDLKSCANQSVGERKQAYARVSGDPGLADYLVASLESEPRTQVVASWFLKHHLESRAVLEPGLVARIYAAANTLVEGEAILHVLQCIARLPIPDSSRARTESFIRKALEHDNKFVRAWAYSGFSQLADTFPQYRDEADQRLRAALETEAPSVTARIRRSLRTAGD